MLEVLEAEPDPVLPPPLRGGQHGLGGAGGCERKVSSWKGRGWASRCPGAACGQKEIAKRFVAVRLYAERRQARVSCSAVGPSGGAGPRSSSGCLRVAAGSSRESSGPFASLAAWPSVRPSSGPPLPASPKLVCRRHPVGGGLQRLPFPPEPAPPLSAAARTGTPLCRIRVEPLPTLEIGNAGFGSAVAEEPKEASQDPLGLRLGGLHPLVSGESVVLVYEPGSSRLQ